jgi:hypothetical protein
LKIENSSQLLVLILEKDKDSGIKENLPILAVGNPREILLLCQKLLSPKSTLMEFFQHYREIGKILGYTDDSMEILSFLRLLEKLQIIKIFELPKEIFKDF